jgi:uncharacterized protein YndB with AHSA1/START domain
MNKQKLRFAIDINAPKKKVWDTMLGDETYRVWTSAFSPQGSWFEGDWNQGSSIRFLGPGKDGTPQGMVSRIKENRPYEYISIEHLGVVENGKEDTTSAAVKDWAGAHENYTFTEKNGVTHVEVDMDSDEKHRQMFEDMWPKALQKLKELAEQ